MALGVAEETEKYSENWQNMSVPETDKLICDVNLENNMYHLAPCCLLSVTPDESISFKGFP